MIVEQEQVHSLIAEENEHRAQVRQVVFVIMHNLIFLDTRDMSTADVCSKIHEFATHAYGADVARIAAERVIDCLMYTA